MLAMVVLAMLAAVATAWWQKRPISEVAALALKTKLEALDGVLVPWMGVSLVTIPIGFFLPFGDVTRWRIVFSLVGSVGVLLVAIRNVILTRLLTVIARELDDRLVVERVKRLNASATRLSGSGASVGTCCLHCDLWWAPRLFGPYLGQPCHKCGRPVTRAPEKKAAP